MYGNVEMGPARPGTTWVPDPSSGEDLCPTEENPYEPLDPIVATPSPKPAADPPGTPWSRRSSGRPKQGAGKGGSRRFWSERDVGVTDAASGWSTKEKLVLVGAVALGVSVLVNVVLLAFGSRHVAALPQEVEEEKAKDLLNVVAALTKELEAERAKAPPDAASRSFLLYNQHQDKCVVAKGHQLMAVSCRPEAASQRFQWLRGARLRHVESRRCVTAARDQNLATVKLEECGEDGRWLQKWECHLGGLLALAGSELYFNYGNNVKGTVMLYSGTGEWSRWLVHGTTEDICSLSCCPPCSKGWSYFQNSCYFYSQTATSWENAQKFCSALGTQLLEVGGPEEKSHVQKMLQSSSWLGIRDEELEGTWKGLDGTILTRENSSWHRSEPNGGRQENCAAVRGDGEWYDYPCTSHLPWVCEGPP